MELFSCTAEAATSDDLLMTKVLEEGLKLKRKCKSLVTKLERVSEERDQIQERYNKLIAEKDKEIEKAVGKIKGDHLVDANAIRDAKQAEVNELFVQLTKAKAEISVLNPQLIGLSNNVQYLEEQLRSNQERYLQEATQLRSEFESERRSLLNRRQDAADEQYSSLLRRALLAEAEIEKLKASSPAATSPPSKNVISRRRGGQHVEKVAADQAHIQAVAALREEIQERDEALSSMAFEVGRLRDELQQSRESLQAREKSLEALQKDLAAKTQSQAAASRSPSGTLTSHVSCNDDMSNESPLFPSLSLDTIGHISPEDRIDQDDIVQIDRDRYIVTLQMHIAELNRQLEAAGEEIEFERNKLRELVEAKGAVEDGVQRVLKENEKLRKRVDELLKAKLQHRSAQIIA